MPTTERSTRKFPLILTTGRILSQYNVGAQTRRTANNTWHPEDVLEIHPADAEVRGISTGDLVDLSSRVGSTTLRALVSERMPAGVVYTTFHHPVTGANVVTTENSDWATNCPEYKVTAVQVGVANARATPPSPRPASPRRSTHEHPVKVPAEARMGNDIARQFAHLPAPQAAEAVAPPNKVPGAADETPSSSGSDPGTRIGPAPRGRCACSPDRGPEYDTAASAEPPGGRAADSGATDRGAADSRATDREDTRSQGRHAGGYESADPNTPTLGASAPAAARAAARHLVGPLVRRCPLRDQAGIFRCSRTAPKTADEVAAQCQTDPRGTMLLLDTLDSLGYVSRRGTSFHLTRMARSTADSPPAARTRRRTTATGEPHGAPPAPPDDSVRSGRPPLNSCRGSPGPAPRSRAGSRRG